MTTLQLPFAFFSYVTPTLRLVDRTLHLTFYGDTGPHAHGSYSALMSVMTMDYCHPPTMCLWVSSESQMHYLFQAASCVGC